MLCQTRFPLAETCFVLHPIIAMIVIFLNCLADRFPLQRTGSNIPAAICALSTAIDPRAFGSTQSPNLIVTCGHRPSCVWQYCINRFECSTQFADLILEILLFPLTPVFFVNTCLQVPLSARGQAERMCIIAIATYIHLFAGFIYSLTFPSICWLFMPVTCQLTVTSPIH